MRTNLSRIKPERLLLFICFLAFSFTAVSQNQPLPKSHPVSLAAPHLPLIQKYDGTDVRFYGEKYSYNGEKSKSVIKLWMANFPSEVIAYKEAMVQYLNRIDLTTLSENDKEVYSDLKSQWNMIIQLN